jgi:hypothetical protein
MQKGGLVNQKHLSQQIAEQIALERAQELVDRAYGRCLEEIVQYLPRDKYTDEERQQLCQFIVENRDDFIRIGYEDTSKFLTMFAEMMNKLIDTQGVEPSQAFIVVFRASERFIQ